jgi:hypothetical protein
MIPMTVLTSIGHVTVERRYLSCAACRAKTVPWDLWAGLENNRRMSPHARRMLTLAGTSWSFDSAAKRLKELCHITVSDDTIERICQEEGQRAQKWMNESDAPVKSFAAATGQAEFYTDGVKVNTTGGWREMRLSVLAKRQAALPATPAQWKDRVLSAPTARMAVCAIAPANVVGSSWKRLADHLSLPRDHPLSVLADGAKWIWREAAKRFGKDTRWIVDIFHVSEHLHTCAKEMLGNSPMARQWADAQLERLIEIEGPRFINELDEQIAATTDGAQRKSLENLRGYLQENHDSMWYATRLKEGLPIGSGLIEGACKNAVAVRLKINNPRWRIRRAEKIAALRCLDYSLQWDPFWQDRAA